MGVMLIAFFALIFSPIIGGDEMKLKNFIIYGIWSIVWTVLYYAVLGNLIDKFGDTD